MDLVGDLCDTNIDRYEKIKTTLKLKYIYMGTRSHGVILSIRYETEFYIKTWFLLKILYIELLCKKIKPFSYIVLIYKTFMLKIKPFSYIVLI